MRRWSASILKNCQELYFIPFHTLLTYISDEFYTLTLLVRFCQIYWLRLTSSKIVMHYLTTKPGYFGTRPSMPYRGYASVNQWTAVNSISISGMLTGQRKVKPRWSPMESNFGRQLQSHTRAFTSILVSHATFYVFWRVFFGNTHKTCLDSLGHFLGHTAITNPFQHSNM